MMCKVCGGKMEKEILSSISRTYSDEGKDYHVIITEVPVEVCDQCGETVYTPDVFDRLLSIAQKVKNSKVPRKTIEVPVFSLKEAEE